MVRLNKLLTATTLLACSATSLADNRTCYYPDHSIAHDDVPCGDGEHVACCGSGAICLSTGLCMNIDQQPYALSRLSCTDESWGSSCPNYCLQEASYNSSWISIVLLTYLDNVAKYCCNNIIVSDGQPACLNDLAPFRMPNANIVENTNLLAGYVKANSTSSSTNSTDASDSACNATTASPSSANSTTSSGSNHDAAIGAGVGVPLGVIALASIAWALWERRKLHRISAAQHTAIAAASAQVPQKQETWNNTNQVQPPAAQYAAPADSQYNGYSNNDVPVSGYQQPIVRNGQSAFSEMASSGPVELEGARKP
ncbi:hypothetical protein PISL3812_06163 [Talaromyces islandicus]|uniref:Uncharacterized protein n=1 Tax=Talaromyces islandicus TaxID=28573 RepID=A0A0U1M0R8_TALIS|nr:hypothetical protein PISL3812_06163 [Talaromyces islandicus]